MCACRTTGTFEQRGIYPPPKQSVTVGEADLKFIHLRDGDDVGLLQYVRGGGIAFPHIMIPESLQLRGAAQTSSLGSNESVGSASIVRRQAGIRKLEGQGDSSTRTRDADEDNSLISTIISQALWLWNAKQHITDIVRQTQTRSLLIAESWLPVPLAQLVFGQVQGTESAAKADAIETENAEGEKSMLAKTHGPITCVAWHPHRSLIAIAHRALDCVFLYDLANDTWCSNILQNAYMKGITSMAWQPNCGYTLAVGCTAGVCLWNILPGSSSSNDFSDTHKAPSLGITQFSSWMTLLAFPQPTGAHGYPSRLTAENKQPLHRSAASVSAISFSHSGQWLVAGHQTHGHLTLWDVALGTATPLKRSGSSSRSATLQVGVSPNDGYLVSTHANGQLRLWETESWTSRVWSDFRANVTQFAWSPDSRSIYFAVSDSPDIYALALYKSPPSLDAEITIVTTFEAHSAPASDGSEDPERIRIGGSIKLLALDPKGQRLVVGFDDDSSSADISLLAVYLVNTEALFRAGGDSSSLMPLGYIRGPSWGKQHCPEKTSSSEAALGSGKPAKKRVRVGDPTPSWLGFSPEFESGALLSVAWANGKVSLVQMLFKTNRLSKV
ncbi:WD40 repeat-like protein [Coemansia reversa NRRL 1564]|uniref:WD40 repeat-like protein n=1 Tax=Coemansia reversa (strain ATCC 12441 / NRRL 1564) TaxID=763665 RepID=A0A2G5BHL9_COERN|nr:WD40 repeat-like protein [Coemansia reversa NRRL 1564]|eukprot:PIA18472.1 WD40 repeat-like protein [Coemansia reversa NRRL 1564]